jgi:hypothetical protein
LRKTQGEITYPIRTNQAGFMEKTVGCFAKKPLEIQSRWWNIWDVTPIKSPLVTRELKVLMLKMYFDYKDYRIAGAKKKMTLTHQNLFGVLRCIFCPNVLSKYVIMVLSSTWKHQS